MVTQGHSLNGDVVTLRHCLDGAGRSNGDAERRCKTETQNEDAKRRRKGGKKRSSK